MSYGVVVNEISESFLGMAHGLRSKKKNVIASIHGTTNIIHIVLMGETPSEISAAYENDPKIPAPPVPLDHVLITFLRKFSQKKLFNIFIHNCCMEKLTYEIWPSTRET